MTRRSKNYKVKYWVKSRVQRVPTGRGVVSGVAVFLLISAFLALLIWGPAYFLGRFAPPLTTPPLTQKEFLDLQNSYRMTYAQIIGGFILAVGAYLAWRTWQTNCETQITQRFAAAIELLGSERDDKAPQIVTRLGAIYALERIARDSPRDHRTIVEIRSGYIRENAP